MSKPILIISKIDSHSGEFYLMEEKQYETTEQYFALFLSNNYKKEYLLDEREQKDNIQKVRQIRHFLKMIEINQQYYYLFRYVKGERIQDFIVKMRCQLKTINQDIIDSFVIQILEALFQLHKLNILGRIFSAENIINNYGTLVLMDFGFGPDIKQDHLDILASPEQIRELLDQNSQIQKINYSALKIDSWLLGAFLYHLVKLRPINSVQNKNVPNKMQIFKYTDLVYYNSYIQEQCKSSDYINAQTNRYKQTLIDFIHGLLTYNTQKRLSFLEIHQSEYIKSLKLNKSDEYINFYTNFQEVEIIEKLIIRGGISQSFVLNSGLLQGQYDLLISSPVKINGKQDTPNEKELESLHITLPYTASFIQDSKYYDIWKQINLEQFRYFILNDTADQIKAEYPEGCYKLSLVAQYALRKQSYIILQDLIQKIQSSDYPWQGSLVTNWQNFKQENKFQFLKHALLNASTITIQSMAQLQEELHKNPKLIENFIVTQKSNELNEVFNNILNEKIIIAQAKEQTSLDIYSIYQSVSTRECSQNPAENLKQSVRDTQQAEWFKGFKEVINHLFKYFNENVTDPNFRQKYSQILLKILYCRLINIIFSFEGVKNHFKNINRLEKEAVTPDEIYCYIESKDNYELKYIEIQDLLNKYFRQ
ncbi:unnamed protein product (macronuclear) [Paramecium tetraurelia]|uniref:Protein kinase domain-containing protein n=1 Tax=Paramecium tetraurelia TaxID=5888 RepID=A0D258_PARTE|nr:uncharacterized protein GSPATT00012631001 [Paramecium tetraurelia]CAK77125.1 unnamed protein product [Paramecium tetraurelia]|eukprot:XP_001444522.1 hypothetical protein (macronuclear) [Paramecium tetraurelia strain d4-2]